MTSNKDQGGEPRLSIPITHLDMPAGVKGKLQRSGILFLSDLLEALETDFIFVHGIGYKSVRKIRDALASFPYHEASANSGVPRVLTKRSSLCQALADLGIQATEADIEDRSLPLELALLLPAMFVSSLDEVMLGKWLSPDNKGRLIASPICEDRFPQLATLLCRPLVAFGISQSLLDSMAETCACRTASDLLMVEDRFLDGSLHKAFAHCVNAIRWQVISAVSGNGTAAKYVGSLLALLGIEEQGFNNVGDLVRSIAVNVARSPKEADIWLSRACVKSKTRPTLANLKEKHGVSRERVRQLEQRMTQQVEEILKAIIAGPEIGGALIQPWIVEVVDSALHEVNEESEESGTLDPITAAEYLGLPEEGGRGSALSLVLQSFDYMRIEIPSEAQSASGPTYYWVHLPGVSSDEIQAAVASVARSLRKSIIPIQEEELVLRVCHETETEVDAVKAAILICPIAVPAASRLSYEVEFQSLKTLADKTYRVLYDAGVLLRTAEIAAEIERRCFAEVDSVAPGSISMQIRADERFASIGRKGIWGLTDWGIEGRSIAHLTDDLLERIQEPVELARLIKYVLQKRPDVKPGSIVCCVENSDQFTISKDGFVDRVSALASRDHVELSPPMFISDMNLILLNALPHERSVDFNADERPLRITLGYPLNLRAAIYLYEARLYQEGKIFYKLQLRLPGQSRGDLGRYALSEREYPILASYVRDRDVFILWDAYMHQGKRYAFTLTVPEEPIIQALGGDIIVRARHGHDGIEDLVICHSSRLESALQVRWQTTLERLSSEHVT